MCVRGHVRGGTYAGVGYARGTCVGHARDARAWRAITSRAWLGSTYAVLREGGRRYVIRGVKCVVLRYDCVKYACV